MGGAEYRIGRFVLQPHRQLRHDGEPIDIGRKPLEILSVLAAAEGALVTKDELMAAVWPAAVVEDNALQAHIAGLRRLLGEDAALLQTRRGFGYSLRVSPASSGDAPGTVEGAPRPGRAAAGTRGVLADRLLRFAPVSTLASLAALAAAALLPRGLERAPALPAGDGRIGVSAWRADPRDPQARAFGRELRDTVTEDLSVLKVPVRAVAAGGPAALGAPRPGGLTLEGEIDHTAGLFRVRTRMVDPSDGLIVWSDDISGKDVARGPLLTREATHVADVCRWVVDAWRGPVKLSGRSLSAFIAGRDDITGVRGGMAAAMSDAETVMAAQPSASQGHAIWAVAAAFELLDGHPGPAETDLRRRAEAEAREAVRLDPRNGEGWLALELLTPRSRLEDRERLLTRAAAVDPTFEPVLMMEGRLLWSLGRGRDAEAWFARAHEVNPLHNGLNFTVALNLATEGLTTQADEVVRRMKADWPDHFSTWDAEFWTRVVEGRYAEADALMGQADGRPAYVDGRRVAAWRSVFRALRGADPSDRRRAIHAVAGAADAGSIDPGLAALMLSLIGDLDGAFGQARRYRIQDPYEPPYLFLPVTAPLRRDPRFLPIARRLGLADYWTRTGLWPDECVRAPGQFDCRAAVAGR